MNNTKHVNVITLFYTSLLKEKKEKLFVQLEYLTQTPFSTTPALIHPSIYSCLDPFFISSQIRSVLGKFHFISNTASCCTDNTARMLTLPVGYNSVGYLHGKGRNIINFGSGYFVQLARGLKAISCISSKWQSFTEHTLVLFSHLYSI